MKFLRKLFSTYFLYLILFLLQVAILYFMLAYLKDYYNTIYLIVIGCVNLIDLIVIFKVINKKEPAEFKIPWIIFLVVTPYFGILAFFAFKNKRISKKTLNTLTAIKEESCEYISRPQDLSSLNEYQVPFAYLQNVTGLHSTTGNKVKYFPLGELYFTDILEKMKNAKQFIFIEFFIISEGKLFSEFKKILLEKAKAGLDIRIMYDDIGSMFLLKRKTIQELKEAGVKVIRFNKLKPIISGIYNNRDHRKIVIIDHDYGYTGGNNLADEYANIITRFGHWKDTGLRIEGKAINNLLYLFLQTWDLTTAEKSDFKALLSYKYPEYDEDGFVIPFGDGPAPFYGDLIGAQNYINMMNLARKSILISSPYLIPTNGLIEAMASAAKRGVDVKLMLPGIPDKKMVYNLAKSNFKYLIAAGVKIYTYGPGFNHNKCMVVDNVLAFDGTINLDYRSLVHHFECGVLMYNCLCIKEITADFEETFAKSTLVTRTKFKFGLFYSILNIFAPML